MLLNNQWSSLKKSKRKLKKIPRDKRKLKYRGLKPMGCSQSCSKREVYGSTTLLQEIKRNVK